MKMKFLGHLAPRATTKKAVSLFFFFFGNEIFMFLFTPNRFFPHQNVLALAERTLPFWPAYRDTDSYLTLEISRLADTFKQHIGIVLPADNDSKQPFVPFWYWEPYVERDNWLSGRSFGFCNAQGKFCPVGCPRVIYLEVTLPLSLLKNPQFHNFTGYKDLVFSCLV